MENVLELLCGARYHLEPMNSKTVRNQSMKKELIKYTKGDIVKIHHKEVIGDNHNISFSPDNISRIL